MKHIPPKNSLQELPSDARDFNLGAVFGQISIDSVPQQDFMVAKPVRIKDQGETDYCSGYAVTSVSEDQEGEELFPYYQFYKTKTLSGDPEEWGANLRDACKSAVKFGSLPISGFKQLQGLSRSQILTPEEWPNHADDVASMHKKETYFAVEGKYDVFDNIRTALWQNHGKQCSIVTGALWRTEWLDAENGIIPDEYGDSGFGHAFKIFGQKNIKGKLYLVAQLSQGEMVGDGGLFYLSREVVNREIGKYGMYMFKDLPREDVEKIIKKKAENENQPITNNFFIKLWSFLTKLFK